MAYIHFGATLIAGWLLCLPGNYDRLAGMPRRYIDYSVLEVNVSQARLIVLLVLAQLLFLFNLIYSAFKGAKVEPRST